MEVEALQSIYATEFESMFVRKKDFLVRSGPFSSPLCALPSPLLRVISGLIDCFVQALRKILLAFGSLLTPRSQMWMRSTRRSVSHAPPYTTNVVTDVSPLPQRQYVDEREVYVHANVPRRGAARGSRELRGTFGLSRQRPGKHFE